MYNYTNEQEILEAFERQALLIEQKLNKKIITLDDLNDELPGSTCISKHDIISLEAVYQSNKALRMTEVTRDEFIKDPVSYIKKRTFPGDLQKSTSWIRRHLSSEQSEHSIGYIQRFRLFDKQEYDALYTLTKKDIRQQELVSIYIRVNELFSSNSRIIRFLDDMLLVKSNHLRFKTLTNREKEIITFLANGLQNNEIAEQLFISKATVEQHRKNLKRKLEIKRFVDLIRFAQAFDLI